MGDVLRFQVICREYHAYHCGHCGTWHAGHKPRPRGHR